ncbi:flavin reductase family protein [Streptomyces sp. NPDC000348]|uniref:flavin reductase family protein n=1 Tax=Streptomyces sp. NPDC000348 TaxID=3364538 RepID=UPI0036BFEE97
MALIAAEMDGRAEAMLVNSLTSVSLKPALVSMAFTYQSTTWQQLRRADELGISILSDEQAGLVPQLRLPNPARTRGVAFNHATSQALVLSDAAATLVVRPHRHVPAGDHTLVLFRVVDHQRAAGMSSLAFFDHRTATVN